MLPSNKLTNVQAMRAIAAIIIVTGHSFSWMSYSMPADILVQEIVRVLGSFAYAGVDLFFVISGLIVTTSAISTANEIPGRLNAAYKFALRRIIRIYPIYWLVLAISIFASRWLSLCPPDWLNLATPFQWFFLLTSRPAPVPQAWSLSFELFFYFILTLAIIIAPRHIFKVIAMWIILSAMAILLIWIKNGKYIVALSPYLFEFTLGSLIAYLRLQKMTEFSHASLILGIAFFLIGAILTPQHGALKELDRVWTFGMGGFLMIYALTSLEQRGEVKSPRWLEMLGDASYSIYLWQFLVIKGLDLAFKKIHLAGHINPTLTVLIWITTTIAIGCSSYRLIEKPTMKAARALTRSRESLLMLNNM